MSFETTVTNKDGNEKRVVADSQEDLDQAVKDVKGEASANQPDINNPAHGNKTFDEFNTPAKRGRKASASPSIAPTGASVANDQANEETVENHEANVESGAVEVPVAEEAPSE